MGEAEREDDEYSRIDNYQAPQAVGRHYVIHDGLLCSATFTDLLLISEYVLAVVVVCLKSPRPCADVPHGRRARSRPHGLTGASRRTRQQRESKTSSQPGISYATSDCYGRLMITTPHAIGLPAS
jgi:hypothetical protein